MKLLHVDSSILGADSVTRTISAEVVAALKAANPGVEVSTRDLAADPLPHLSLSNLPAGHPLAAAAGAGDPAEGARSAAVLDEFLAADVVVVGAPMYNFTIPSQLKAWIDRLLIAGKTFSYGPTGPKGLVTGKRVIFVVARGGFYGQGSPAASLEHLDSYLLTTFRFIGVENAEVIIAEGLQAGPEHRQTGLDKAIQAAREAKAA